MTVRFSLYTFPLFIPFCKGRQKSSLSEGAGNGVDWGSRFLPPSDDGLPFSKMEARGRIFHLSSFLYTSLIQIKNGHSSPFFIISQCLAGNQSSSIWLKYSLSKNSDKVISAPSQNLLTVITFEHFVLPLRRS